MKYDNDAWACAGSVLVVDHAEAFRVVSGDYLNLFEYYVNQLIEYGMSKAQADDVARMAYKYFISNSVGNGYCPNFRFPFDNYSQCERDAYWRVFKRCALEYIDEKCPSAWFREMFVEVEVL
jgi:hypothetical protein